jgi:hypothetical protein
VVPAVLVLPGDARIPEQGIGWTDQQLETPAHRTPPARPGDPIAVTDLARLAPRSAGAVADIELLRVARTDLDDPEASARLSLTDRIRDLAPLRALRPTDDRSTPVRLDRSHD